MSKMIRRSRKKDSQGKEIERRRERRLGLEEISSIESSRLLAGPEVQLLNLSRGGALLQSNTRIAPGVKIGIRLIAGDAEIFLRGLVLRSRVSELKGATLTYEWAITFDETCTLFDYGEEGLQTSEDSNAVMVLEEAAKAASENWMAADMVETADLITVTIPVPTSGSAVSRSATKIATPGA